MRSRAKGFHARVKGFTLVEVAISVAIVAALTGAVALVVTNNASDAAGNTSAAKGGVVQMQDGLGTVRDGLAGPRPVAPFAIGSVELLVYRDTVSFNIAGGSKIAASSFLATLADDGIISTGDASGLGTHYLSTGYYLPFRLYDADGVAVHAQDTYDMLVAESLWLEWFEVRSDWAREMSDWNWVTGEILIPGYQPIPFTRWPTPFIAVSSSQSQSGLLVRLDGTIFDASTSSEMPSWSETRPVLSVAGLLPAGQGRYMWESAAAAPLNNYGYWAAWPAPTQVVYTQSGVALFLDGDGQLRGFSARFDGDPLNGGQVIPNDQWPVE